MQYEVNIYIKDKKGEIKIRFAIFAVFSAFCIAFNQKRKAMSISNGSISLRWVFYNENKLILIINLVVYIQLKLKLFVKISLDSF